MIKYTRRRTFAEDTHEEDQEKFWVKDSEKRHIPKSVIRRLNQESSEGGRATCEICRVAFSMNYIDRVKLSSFRIGFACKDCRKTKNLPKL
jgi:hypothetical protein